MPMFAYQARNKEGKRVSGKREGENRREVLLALREAELFVTKLAPLHRSKPRQAQETTSGKWWWRASPKNRSLYFRQMQAMLKSGTSLAAALHTMIESAPNSALRQASQEMTKRTNKGEAWSAQMQEYPGLFSPLVIAMVRSGEEGGFLDKACGHLADYAEQDHHIQQVVTRETWYPKLVVLVSILTLSLPPLAVAIFKGRGVPQALWNYIVAISGPLGVIFLLWLVFGGYKFFMPLARHLKPLTRTIDQLKLLVPGASKTVRYLAISKFCRAFGALNTAGLDVGTSFRLASDACGNAAVAARINEAIPKVEQGKSITDALAATKQFPNMVVQMLRTGETSGDFEGQLNSVAEFMEQESESAIHKSMVLLGILVLLAVAAMVAYYVINFYTSYYNNIFNEANSMMPK